MKKILFAWILAIGSLVTAAQEQAFQPLQIGDPFPTQSFPNLLYADTKTFELNKYKGKWVILQFCTGSCSGCQGSMPVMDSLQKLFQDQVQMIVVTRNSEKKLLPLFQLLKDKKPPFPVLAADTLLHHLFPHKSVPHHVWINKEGKVDQITNMYSTNKANIQAALSGKALNLPLKYEFVDFNPKQPLWQEGGGRLHQHLQYYAYVMNHISEFGGSSIGQLWDSAHQTMGFKVVNQSILTMYKIAAFASYPMVVPDNRVVFNIKDKESLLPPADKSLLYDWSQKHVFSYEMQMPMGPPRQIFEHMLQDLNRFFPYTGRLEKRKIKCLALTIRRAHRFRNKQESKAFTPNGGTVIQDLPLSSFMYLLEQANQKLPIPVIDLTGYTGKVNLNIQAQLNDLAALRKELRQYGLDLKEKEWLIDVLVLLDD